MGFLIAVQGVKSYWAIIGWVRDYEKPEESLYELQAYLSLQLGPSPPIYSGLM